MRKTAVVLALAAAAAVVGAGTAGGAQQGSTFTFRLPKLVAH